MMQEKAKRRRENRLAQYKPYLKQKEFHEAGAVYRERLFMAGNQLGKEQPVDEPVLTPSGWKPIGSLAIGDEVIAGDGSATKVIGVYPQGVKPTFRLTFDDGAWTRCGEEHLWAARITRRERFGVDKNSEWPVYSLRQIREWGGDRPIPAKRAVIPVATRAELDAWPVPLDPYLLGVLLGDGGWAHTSIVVSSADEEILQAVRDALPSGCLLNHRGKYDWNINCTLPERRDELGRIFGQHPVRLALKWLGLDRKACSEKFVPECYLWNSDDVRLAVLQGLLDTDGSVSKDGAIEFSSTSEQLAEDVRFLARSFGGKVKWECRQTSCTYKGVKVDGRPSIRLRIRLPHVPVFRLKRKLDRCIRPVSTTDHRVLYAIDPCGAHESVCIAVQHPSQTYITRDFIVTHNTIAGGFEAAIHATGLYPDWWQGKRFDRPTKAWAAGVTSESTRDNPQRILLGPVGQMGTGAIPKDMITDYSSARGITGLIDTVQVRHATGGVSTIGFKSYEKGREKWQGETLNWLWFDEEPPIDIYMEGLTRTNATRGITFITFTPLLGMSNVVMRFIGKETRSPNTHVTMMTIDDAEHYTPEEREAIIASYPPHEREARVKGIPSLGSGRVFPVLEEGIACDPVEIPEHWPQIGGMDFGYDHPFAAVRLAWNRDDDIIYVTSEYRAREATPVIHAAAIRPWSDWLPWAWPHDGLQHDKGSGDQLAKQYSDQGLKMLPERATFADGTHGVEAGIMDMLDRMQTGRLKVFRHLGQWFEEFRLYHRDDGKIVKERDDLLCATRYAMMMLRHARTKPKNTINKPRHRSWMG